MLTLYHGRPEDESNRLQKEIRTYDFLDALGISYDRTDHAPATTMEVCKEIDGSLGAVICKNLFLCNRQKTDFYLLVMPGDKKFKTKDLSAQINSARLSFGDAAQMQAYLDIEPGSVSILGLMNDKDNHVRLLVDKDVMHGEYYACHPCINTSSIRFKQADLWDKIIPAMGHEPTFVTLPVYE